MEKHTTGPWEVGGGAKGGAPGYVYCNNYMGSAVAICFGIPALRHSVFTRAEEEANARLIAAAPDHAAIAAALCSGAARWEAATNEFCIAGIRHSTKLDEFGVPVMTSSMRAAIAKATTP